MTSIPYRAGTRRPSKPARASRRSGTGPAADRAARRSDFRARATCINAASRRQHAKAATLPSHGARTIVRAARRRAAARAMTQHAEVAPEIPDADRQRAEARESVAGENQQDEQRVHRAAATSIQTSGIRRRDAAAGRRACRAHARDTLRRQRRWRRGPARRTWETDRLRLSDTRGSCGPRDGIRRATSSSCRRRRSTPSLRSRRAGGSPDGAARDTAAGTAASAAVTTDGRCRQRDPHARVGPEPRAWRSRTARTPRRTARRTAGNSRTTGSARRARRRRRRAALHAPRQSK